MTTQSRSAYRPVPMVDARGFAVAIYVACQWVIEAKIGQ